MPVKSPHLYSSYVNLLFMVRLRAFSIFVASIMDEAAFEKLFKENFALLCAWCQYKFNFEFDTARDAVHSGFIHLWNHRQTLSAELPVKPYLYKTITNISLDLLRHEKVKNNYAAVISLNNSALVKSEAFDQYDLKLLTADINMALSQLPEQMRIVFELSRNDGLKYAEIASKLNISIKTVETHMGRALAKLRHKLAPYLNVLCLVFLKSLLFFKML